jgi:hypothetical protein
VRFSLKISEYESTRLLFLAHRDEFRRSSLIKHRLIQEMSTCGATFHVYLQLADTFYGAEMKF